MFADTLYLARTLPARLAGRTGLWRKTISPAWVLTYHGVLGNPLPVPDWCFLSVRDFENQIRFLQRHFELVHLEELFQAEGNTKGKPRLALTFDDGYASNFKLVFPILKRLGIPATIFLVTDLVDTDDTVWFCRLHDAICRTSLEHVDHEGIRADLRGVDARVKASALFQAFLKGLPADALLESCMNLVARLGFDWNDPLSADSPFRILSSDQIRSMAESGLIRFGGHTLSHAILSLVDDATLTEEIRVCVNKVSELAGRPCTTFAYPNGRLGDFDERAVLALKEYGIGYSVTTTEGPNFEGCDRHLLRRHGVGDGESLALLAMKLSKAGIPAGSRLATPSAAS